MLSASAYLEGLAAFLEQHLYPFVVGPILDIDPLDKAGTLEGVIAFPDGCELHVNLVVNYQLSPLTPLATYRFHCQDSRQQCVVRFDNVPHHRDVATFPHHVHVGTRILPHPQPTGREVVAHILSYHNQHQ